MKHVWTMEGTYLQWELVVTVEPGYDPPCEITELIQSEGLERMKGLGPHFVELVNLSEFALEFDSVHDIGFGLRQDGEPLSEQTR